jgi:hypothetical protein
MDVKIAMGVPLIGLNIEINPRLAAGHTNIISKKRLLIHSRRVSWSADENKRAALLLAEVITLAFASTGLD